MSDDRCINCGVVDEDAVASYRLTTHEELTLCIRDGDGCGIADKLIPVYPDVDWCYRSKGSSCSVTVGSYEALLCFVARSTTGEYEFTFERDDDTVGDWMRTPQQALDKYLECTEDDYELEWEDRFDVVRKTIVRSAEERITSARAVLNEFKK